MSTTQLKSDIHKLVDKTDSNQLLNTVYSILYSQSQSEDDFWATLTEEQQHDIKAGLADLDAGRKVPAADVMARYT